jgi:hypothetical protein
MTERATQTSDTCSGTAGDNWITPAHGGGRLRPFQRGVSGNPGGRGGQYHEARRICREASPAAAKTLIELMRDKDPRIRGWASDRVLSWAFGKPPDYNPEEDRPSLVVDLARLTPDQLALLRLMIDSGAIRRAVSEIDVTGEEQGPPRDYE